FRRHLPPSRHDRRFQRLGRQRPECHCCARLHGHYHARRGTCTALSDPAIVGGADRPIRQHPTDRSHTHVHVEHAGRQPRNPHTRRPAHRTCDLHPNHCHHHRHPRRWLVRSNR